MDYASFRFDQFQTSWPAEPNAAAPAAAGGPQPMLGALLVQMGALAPDRLAEAVASQAQTGEPLAQVLITRGLCTVQQVVDALAYRPQYGG